MKRLILYSLALVWATTACIAQDRYPTVAVKAGKLMLDGYTVSQSWSVQPVLDRLGKPDRIKDGYNMVYTYNSGIVVFESKSNDKGTGLLSELQFHFEKTLTTDIGPDNVYRGTVTVEKLKATYLLGAREMLTKLKKYAKTDSYMEHNYRMAYKGLYVYFLFNDSETALKKISIGPDKRK